ncbi:sensor histidine kinase [Agromyces seonyuensis]|uniref:histidine kinase n=1 Tax=Agromyces seonyuensis TaxID=2662446 RepID=A0A6I4P6B9_9MICO|nr:sensor histidine kinase [Agromyces seonyuensis]MWB99154.1 sensor histidine kinase [Agromyces seonyuensis]
MTAATVPLRFRAGAATPAPPVVPGVEWVRPRPDARGIRNDAILAALIAAGMVVGIFLTHDARIWSDPAPWWASVVWIAASSVPLIWRRVQPELVALVVCLAYGFGTTFQAIELVFSQIALFMVVYAVGAWGRNRMRAGIVRGVIVVGEFTWLFVVLLQSSNIVDPPDARPDAVLSPYVAYSLIQIITNMLFFGGAWLFGDRSYAAAREHAALEQRTAELSAERERSRDQAVRLERVRIARELHDSVAHHVSVMGVQAGAARRVLERDPAAATSALTSIESSAREAVDELHRLLGTLREAGSSADGVDPAGASASTLNVARIGDLVAETREAGLPVEFTELGEARPAPPSIQVAGYRIAQEALTNVRKHAGPTARADVRVRWSTSAVEIEVVNTGTTASRSGSRAEGLGLIGMRERVDALGGSLETGPRSQGGYLVRASLPLTAATAADPATDAAPERSE